MNLNELCAHMVYRGILLHTLSLTIFDETYKLQTYIHLLDSLIGRRPKFFLFNYIQPAVLINILAL